MTASQTSPLPPVVDPDNVPETLCNGQFNVTTTGDLVTLTFTHNRPKLGPMFAGTIENEAVVRARIVLRADTLVALRDLLNTVVATPGVPAPTAGGSAKH